MRDRHGKKVQCSKCSYQVSESRKSDLRKHEARHGQHPAGLKRKVQVLGPRRAVDGSDLSGWKKRVTKSETSAKVRENPPPATTSGPTEEGMPIVWIVTTLNEDIEEASTPTLVPRDVEISSVAATPGNNEFSATLPSGSETGSVSISSNNALRVISWKHPRPASPDHMEMSKPGYEPKLIPLHREHSVYDSLHIDPRLFFLGAPSVYQDTFPSALVRRVRLEAVQNRLVPTVVWRPEGVSAIRRIERVEFRDEAHQTATVYSLSSVWTFDQMYGMQREVATQTPPPPPTNVRPSTSVKVQVIDVSVQVPPLVTA